VLEGGQLAGEVVGGALVDVCDTDALGWSEEEQADGVADVSVQGAVAAVYEVVAPAQFVETRSDLVDRRVPQGGQQSRVACYVNRSLCSRFPRQVVERVGRKAGSGGGVFGVDQGQPVQRGQVLMEL
jgi:hypothetical protein